MISIGLVTFNRVNYLKQAIDSILNQTYSDFELLIFDNGSTKETEILVKNYSDSRINYFRNDKNDRNYLNEPFKKAKGEYLIIVHDDDILHEELIEHEKKTLDANPDLLMVSCDVTIINENGDIINNQIRKSKISKSIFNQYQYIRSFINQKKNAAIYCPTVMMRRNFFINNNLKFDFSVGPGADNFLWLNVNLLAGQICILHETLYYYRVHSKQDSSLNLISLNIQLYDAIFDFLYKNGIELWNINFIIRLLRYFLLGLEKKVITQEYYHYKLKKYMKCITLNFKWPISFIAVYFFDSFPNKIINLKKINQLIFRSK